MKKYLVKTLKRYTAEVRVYDETINNLRTEYPLVSSDNFKNALKELKREYSGTPVTPVAIVKIDCHKYTYKIDEEVFTEHAELIDTVKLN